ncbi:hypothetical protein MNV84_05029 [Leishmania braziliensis]|nr:hypothetical protein MNV84_05029 [Leishmania braziliensis]
MPLCASVPATVDTDMNTRALYLEDLDKCMKNFSDSLTTTMNSYRNLLTAFDQVGQVYGNVAQECGNEVRKLVDEFRDGMRDLKDKGGFETFNREIHSGTISVMEPVKVSLKKAVKSLKSLKVKQKEYDTVRYELEKTETSYAKKSKPLSESKNYKKTLEKRDKMKESYDISREAFGEEVKALQATTKSVLLESLNNYLHCTAAFCGQLEVTMNGYRTDLDQDGCTTFANDRMDQLKEKAEAESMTRRSQRKSETLHPYQAGSNAALNNTHPNLPSVDDDLYPRKDSQLDPESANCYPNADSAPLMHNSGENSILKEQYDNATHGNADTANPLIKVNDHE